MEEVDRTTLSSARWEEKFFPNAQLTKLDIELFQHDLDEMHQFLANGKFSSDNEGWRYLLASGYSYARGQEQLEPIDETGEPNPIGAEENLRRLVQIEAMYAVMKQRAYIWMKDNQVMEMQTNALRIRGDGYKIKCEDLEVEVKALKTELAQLKARQGKVASNQVTTSSPATDSTSASRLKRLLKR
ncbi:MAG: hypothetical protein HY870_04420 [Chloroflexi bacterium]|nr:hypothetical protein [Chloroflexota bacterium]